MGGPPPTIFPVRKLDEWAFYKVHGNDSEIETGSSGWNN